MATGPGRHFGRRPAGSGLGGPGSPVALLAKMAANLEFAQCLPPTLSASNALARLADPRAVERCLSEPVMNWRV